MVVLVAALMAVDYQEVVVAVEAKTAAAAEQVLLDKAITAALLQLKVQVAVVAQAQPAAQNQVQHQAQAA